MVVNGSNSQESKFVGDDSTFLLEYKLNMNTRIAKYRDISP